MTVIFTALPFSYF